MMNDIESLYRMAAENYRHAGRHLEETEDSLRKWLARLESPEKAAPVAAVATPVGPAPLHGAALWTRVDELLVAGRPVAPEEPVSAVS